MATAGYNVILLPDRPDLATQWATLHWREWGTEPGREELSWWVNDAFRALGRTAVPVAFLALGPGDEVLGGVGLHQFDRAELRDSSPWVVGMVVRADRRGTGIGRALLDSLDAWAASAGITQVWVVTGPPAVGFYRRCGYQPIKEVDLGGGPETVLTRRTDDRRS